MDVDTGRVLVRELGGGTRQGQLPGVSVAMRDAQIRRFRLDFESRRLVLELPNGNPAVVELPWPGRSACDALGSRRVVYLDQRDWSTLAAVRHGLRPVAPAEASAAQELFALVDSGDLVLPLSAAHFIESDRLHGPSRVPLASTLLELSRGWQMRHPMNIGRDELAANLGLIDGAPETAGVYTLEPNASFVRFPPPETSEYPEPLRSIMPAVIAVSGTYDAVVGHTPAPDAGGDEARAAWVADHEHLIGLLAADGASPDMVRRTALARQLLEIGTHLVHESRVDVDTLRSLMTPAWFATLDEAMATMPYVSRLSHVYFARLRNMSPWTANDLNDIHFLSAAAGYAHVLVGERRTIGDLRGTRSMQSGAELATSLVDAVTAAKT